MSVSGGSSASIGDVNPFSPIAVAKVMEEDWASIVNVDTQTINTATRIVDEYLATYALLPGSGTPTPIGRASASATILAVVGDYGTGKTHLVVELLRHVRQTAGERVRSLYLEANSDSFRTVYKRFIEKLDLAEIRDQVKRYYAEVVADSLGESDLTKGIAEGLRSGNSDPTLVVENFGLLESTLLTELRDRLRAVTQNAAFATVLMLLLRPGFEAVAWAWLEGKKPDLVLIERGVTSRIDDDMAALEAMGVIAELYRAGNRRFLLVIDEMDKVLLAAGSPGRDVFTAFKQLLQVFAAAGAMLVLAGLPDFLETITSVSPETRDRIGAVIRMQPLTQVETRTLIEESQHNRLNKRRLAPFTPETVEYVVHLSRGIARRVIHLLYHSFRRAGEAGTRVTIEIVREVARNELYLPRNEENVRDLVRDVLVRNGWPFRINQQISADPPTIVDYWISPDDGPAGYAVLVTGSVIDDKDVAHLRGLAQVFAEARAGVEVRGTLLVVNGYLPANLAVELGGVFGVKPVLYEPSSFAAQFTQALGSLAHLQVVAGADSLALVNERVDRINRQQASLHDNLAELASTLQELRAASDNRLDAIVDQLRGLTLSRTAVEGEPAGQAVVPEAGPAPRLPQEVEQLFADAFQALAELDGFDLLLRDAFGTGERPEVTSTRRAIRTRLSIPDSTQAAGVAVLLRKTIEAFRDGAEEWYAAHEAGPGTDWEQLDTICFTYDAISEYLPSFHLADLGELSVPLEDELDPGMRVDRRLRQARVRDTLENLSLRVRDGLLRAVSR